MITVYTPAYNRAHTLHRVYDSLKSQTYRDFEWVIVDDGSTDDTKERVEEFQSQNTFFPIRYFYQENRGKHIATNRAVREARGSFFITLDSDGGCKPEALERLMEVWNTIPVAQRMEYKGVSCRCCKPDQPDAIIGTALPGNAACLDSNDHDLRYRYHVKGELWGMSRREVLLEHPYPAVPGLRYYPEGVYWGKLGLQYKTRYFDEPLRIYYTDGTQQDGQLTKRVNAKETYYAREYFMSPQMIRTYFWYDPWNFYQQAVGFVRDGLLSGRTFRALLSVAAGSKRGCMLFFLGAIPGKILEICEKRKN